MRVADDTFYKNSECELVTGFPLEKVQLFLNVTEFTYCFKTEEMLRYA